MGFGYVQEMAGAFRVKPSDFKHYAEYMGGLGDVILRLNTSPWYASLENLSPGEEAAVVLMCHNTGASGLWKWHPNRDRIHVFDFGMSHDFHPWENAEWRHVNGLPIESPCPPPYNGPVRFYPSPEDLPHLNGLRDGGPYAIVAPIAGSSERTIPPELQSGILAGLMEHGIRPVFVGLSRYGRPIQSPGAVDLIDRLSAPGTIEAIRGASLVVTAHSSTLHMAWFEKRPVFLLYPEWVRQVWEKHGPVGYFFGAEFPTTDHMEFRFYSRERLDRLIGVALKEVCK
jgi:hypothetical protein